MPNIVERLRAHAGFIENGGCADHGMTDEPWLLREAANEIERLRLDFEQVHGMLEIERRISAELRAEIATPGARPGRISPDLP